MIEKPKHTSSYYAAQFRKSELEDAAFVKPDSIPLDYARPFHPFPFAFEPYPFQASVNWIWINLVFDRNFWLSLSAALCGIVALILLIVSIRRLNRTAGVFAALFSVASSVLIWLRVNAAKNENHRRALCYLYEKKEQAKKVWAEFGESEQMYSKDVFYETSTFQGEYRVLRDGTVEVVPYATYEGTESLLRASVGFNGEAHIEIDDGTGNPISIKASANIP